MYNIKHQCVTLFLSFMNYNGFDVRMCLNIGTHLWQIHFLG